MTEFEYILKYNEVENTRTQKKLEELFRKQISQLHSHIPNTWNNVTIEKLNAAKYNFSLATFARSKYTGAKGLPSRMVEYLNKVQPNLINVWIHYKTTDYTEFNTIFQHCPPIKLSSNYTSIKDIIAYGKLIGSNPIKLETDFNFFSDSKFDDIFGNTKNARYLNNLIDFIHNTKHLDLDNFTFLRAVHEDLLDNIERYAENGLHPIKETANLIDTFKLFKSEL